MASFKEIAQSKGVNSSDDRDHNGQSGEGRKRRTRRPWFNEEERPVQVEPQVMENKNIEDAWLSAKTKMSLIKNSSPKAW